MSEIEKKIIEQSAQYFKKDSSLENLLGVEGGQFFALSKMSYARAASKGSGVYLIARHVAINSTKEPIKEKKKPGRPKKNTDDIQ